MITILYAHPYPKSFNHAILDTLRSRFDADKRPYTVLDLYADGFNPSFEADSLALYSKGQSADPMVKHYQQVLMDSDTIIMIFPIWWSMMPAIVKGFFDKVMLEGTAFTYSETGALVPDKINIDRTVILTTSEAPSAVFASFFTDYFPRHVLDTVGMRNVEWYNCEGTSHGPAENREAFLATVDSLF